MFCPNCSRDCGDAKFCSNCGRQLKENVTVLAADNAHDERAELIRKYEKYKVKGNKIKTIGAIRKGTGLSKDEAMLIADELFIDEMPPMRTYERDQKKKAEMDAAGQVYCPKCLSTSISTNQKGFGFGRGAIGAAIGLDVGLIAGGIGSKKIICTCLKCGYQWKPGTK